MLIKQISHSKSIETYNPTTGLKTWYKFDIAVEPEQNEDIEEVKRKLVLEVDKSFQMINSQPEEQSATYNWQLDNPYIPPQPKSTLEIMIDEMNKCTAISKKNRLGVEEGLLFYADKFPDNEQFRIAFDKKMEKLKNA